MKKTTFGFIALLIVATLSLNVFAAAKKNNSNVEYRNSVKNNLMSIALEYLNSKNNFTVTGAFTENGDRAEAYKDFLQKQAKGLREERLALQQTDSDYSSYATTFRAESVKINGEQAILIGNEITQLDFANKDVSTNYNYYKYGLKHTLTFVKNGDGWRLTSDETDDGLHSVKPRKGDAGAAFGFPETKIDYDSSSQFLLDAINSPLSYSSLNRQAIVAYAFQYAWSNNPAYRYYGNQGQGGDCTNFVSQCLRAGAWTDVPGFYQSSAYWWYSWANNSLSWSVANNFFQFIGYRPRAALSSSTSQLQLGDIVQFDWNRDGTIDHSAIVTRITNGVIYITYHNGYGFSPAMNKPLMDLTNSGNPRPALYGWRLYSYPN